MNKYYFLCFAFIIIAGCYSVSHETIPKNWKELDLGQFKLKTPPNWKFQDPGEQEDSFVEQITGPGVELSFDCSERGYANHLDYIKDKIDHIKIDTNAKYIVKTIWPTMAHRGVTGVYIHSRTSTFNFQMSSENLSKENQELVLKAFKTTTFK